METAKSKMETLAPNLPVSGFQIRISSFWFLTSNF